MEPPTDLCLISKPLNFRAKKDSEHQPAASVDRWGLEVTYGVNWNLGPGAKPLCDLGQLLSLFKPPHLHGLSVDSNSSSPYFIGFSED